MAYSDEPDDLEEVEDAPKAKGLSEAEEKQILEDADEWFKLCEEAESHNRLTFLEDTKFARLPMEHQWPTGARKAREDDGRPCLTVSRMAPIIRQVVNDSRQNKPSIKVHPADDGADVETSEIFNGLIRNIEYTSDAEVAYDTAVDNAVTGGFGYWRVNTRYASDDTFDQDIVIERVPDPLKVYGDPYSMSADSADWNVAFVIEAVPKKLFERKYKGAEKVDWTSGDYSNLKSPWMDDDRVIVAEYWTRTESEEMMAAYSDGQTRLVSVVEADPETFAGITMVGKPRPVASHKVTQHILTGCEVLETVEWAGKYIPIVPVYGDEVIIEGKRYLRSLIGDAKDAQRQINYWVSAATELVALAPKAPFIGVKGQFDTDQDKWATANTESHAYIEYDAVNGAMGPPQRQPFAGIPAGALQMMATASDDIKAITGIYDASLGARSNETSGRAILARQREGDVSTFHFIDNLSRAIRHCGRILIDLIPHVYTGERVLRVIGEDGTPDKKPLGQAVQALDENGKPKVDENGKPITRIYDLAAGKYDLTVASGPSFTTRREEAAAQMIDLIRAYPAAAPLIGDLLAKNLDWPGADEVARRLKAMLPPQITGENPEMGQVRQQLQALQQALQQAGAQLEGMKADKGIELARLDIERGKLKVDEMNAETNRIKAVTAKDFPLGPDAVAQLQPLVLQAVQQLLNSPDLLPPDPGQQPMESMMAPMQPQAPQGFDAGQMMAEPPQEPLAAPSDDEAEQLALALSQQ